MRPLLFIAKLRPMEYGLITVQPRDRKTLAAGVLQPQRRELVFDIDMTDYDEIRTCCSDKKICKRCWGYIAAAVKILDHSLRGQSGYTPSRPVAEEGRYIWLQTSPMGLLRSTRNTLLDIGPAGFGFE